MDSLLATVTALLVSLTVIPVMIRLAPSLRLLDQPSARKVHVNPVPRVGGWGITLGALFSVLLWLPLSPIALAFVLGALILLVAGAVDDSRDLPAQAKLMLQIAAALLVIVYAGLAVVSLPLVIVWQIPLPLAVVLTVIGLVACINATNTSDGLDGLAAGETLLSLAGIVYLASVNGITELLLISAAAVGGLAGFLRYNTHPAAVFMGDSGSQFLGFVVGFLGLALVQSLDTGLTPWTLLLLIGLPPADLAIVAIRRLRRGTSAFRADNTHIHHRLLALGFPHQQCVIYIYAIQASFVFFAIALSSSQQWKILLVYALHLAVIYGFLSQAEASLRERRREVRSARRRQRSARPLLVWTPRVALETLIPLVLIICALLTTVVPTDVGALAGVLAVPLTITLFRRATPPSFVARIPLFMITAAVLYLYTDNRPFISSVSRITEVAGIAAVAMATAAALKFSPKRRRQEFHTTALDYLLVMVALLALLVLPGTTSLFDTYFLFYLPIVLYGCEIITVERRERPNWLPLATLLTALILVVRGLLL